MDLLKTIFPFSFNKKINATALVIHILIYIVAGAIVGLLTWVLSLIPAVGGFLAGIVGAVGGLYVLIGIVLSVLDYLKVLK